MADPDEKDIDEPDETVRQAETEHDVGPGAPPITRQGQRVEPDNGGRGEADDLAP